MRWKCTFYYLNADLPHGYLAAGYLDAELLCNRSAHFITSMRIYFMVTLLRSSHEMEVHILLLQCGITSWLPYGGLPGCGVAMR